MPSKFQKGTAQGPRLTVMLDTMPPLEGEAGWMGLFKCTADDCPNLFEARIAQVRNGNTKSCGCLKGDVDVKANPRVRKGRKSQIERAEAIRADALLEAGGVVEEMPSRRVPKQQKIPTKAELSLVSQLAELKDMHESGALTKKEFSAAKAQLIETSAAA